MDNHLKIEEQNKIKNPVVRLSIPVSLRPDSYRDQTHKDNLVLGMFGLVEIKQVVKYIC